MQSGFRQRKGQCREEGWLQPPQCLCFGSVITSFEEFNKWFWEWYEKDADRLHYKYKVPAVVEPGAGRDLRPGDIRPGSGRAGTVNTCPAKGSDNARVWDTSKRAIQIVLNNLKGIFFRDDDLEQMTFSGTGRRGETGITILRISAFQEVGDYDLAPAFPPAILLYIKIVSLIFICCLATIILF